MRLFTYVLGLMFPLLSFLGVALIASLLECLLGVWSGNMGSQALQQKPCFNYSNKQSPLTDKYENMFWFIHISDVHISQFRDSGQVADLHDFCKNDLPNIKPSLVLVTGDMVDAKDLSSLGSQQNEKEWAVYASLVKSCLTAFPVTWLDVRGNHDVFQVPHHQNDLNMHQYYGANQNGHRFSGSYQYIHRTPFGDYAFNAVDLTPNPGFGRPFNFFGVPGASEMEQVAVMALSSCRFNSSVWFGHYPLSVTTQSLSLRKMISSGIVYLCGHLHTLLGAFPKMHTLHREGFLELENGDWKDNRRFRLAAFDHDIFSFVDLEYPTQPIILITNPKDSQYLVAGKEPYERARSSSHIRFLVFSAASIVSAVVNVDNDLICKDLFTVNGPLYACRWNPDMFASGIHLIEVIVTDSSGKVARSIFHFSLDGTRSEIGLRSAILLLTNFFSLSRVIFFASVSVYVVMPFLMRKARHYQVLLCRAFFGAAVPQVLSFVDNGALFWPTILYSAYLACGPISIGYFAPDGIGIAFSFGIFSHGTFIPEPLLYLYASAHFLVFNTIVMIYTGEAINPQSDIFNLRCSCGRSYRLARAMCFHFSLLFLFWLEASSARTFWVAYGTLAFILNPIKTWSIPLLIYLVMKAYFERYSR